MSLPPIDFTKCTMSDVIQRSVLLHPTLFVERLRAAAKIHYDYSHTTTRREVACIAANMACDLRRVATEIETGSLDTTKLSSSELILAFGEAAKLNCVRYDIQQDIAKRENMSLRS